MAQKTSGEFEKAFMDSLESSTGKELSEWMTIIDGFSCRKRPEQIAWLKAEHGFGHMDASLLAGIHANGGKPVYQNTDSLLDAQFAKAAEMRPLFEEVVRFVKEKFPRRDHPSEKDLRRDPRKPRVRGSEHQTQRTPHRTRSR